MGLIPQPRRAEISAKPLKTHHEDGGSRADKYSRDLQLLQQDLEKDPGNTRTTFYLAQTYRDLGKLPQAMDWYGKRALMGGWDEEVWYSLYQIGRAQHRFGMAWPIVLSSYLTAYASNRLEPLYYIARFYREVGEYALGELFARPVLETPYPDDLLFVEKPIYTGALLQEYETCRTAVMRGA